MKKRLKFLIAIMLIALTSCGKSNNTPTPTADEPGTTTTIPANDKTTDTTEKENATVNMELTLKIDGIEVAVICADNDSVKALKNLVKNGLSINMSKYGGFEQVESICSALPSVDTRITPNPGDIVLYSSHQIVIFYDSNTWSYMKLGHINLSKKELVDLLGDEDVVLTLNLK